MPEYEVAIFDPHHPNANIHGVVGSSGTATCQTTSGELCTGCCTALRITEIGDSPLVLKAEGEDCSAQIPGSGCSYLQSDSPEQRYAVCGIYHCSGDRAKITNPHNSRLVKLAAAQRLAMANAAALSNGEIDRTTYRENLARIPTP